MKKVRVFSSKKLRVLLLAMACCLAGVSSQAAGVLQPVDPSAKKLQVNDMMQRKQMVIDDENRMHQQALSGETTFHLQKIDLVIEGNVLPNELQPILTPYENRDVSFAELQKAASEVNTYLRKKKGYYLATAFYPQQDIEKGRVIMKVVAGTYGQVRIHNETCLSDHRAVSFSDSLHQGEEIKTRAVENVLENYNNLPGIDARAVMKPGSRTGESDMDIYLNTIKDTEVSLFTDNYGSKYAGRYRYGANVTFNNPNHNGDALTVGGLLSTDGNTKDYWMSYEVPNGHYGSRVGVSFSHMGYELGDWYTRMGAKGKANTLSLYGSTPLIQKSDTFMKLLYGISYRWFSDEYSSFGYESKKETGSFYLGLGGAYESPRTYTSYTAIYSRGNTENTHLTFNGQNHDELTEDAGNFHKFNLDAVHVDHLRAGLDLHLTFHGQMASRALDGSEKMSLGGPYGVRAYPSSEGSVDAGYQASAELQYKIGKGLAVGSFFDIGEGTTDKNNGRHRLLRGWGIGFQYMNKKEYYHRQPQWYVRLDWARKVKAEDTISTTSNSHDQIWFRIVTML